MKIKTGLRVSIDAEALERIWHWTGMAKGEFSCLGLVTDDVLAHDVRLFDQVCAAASTEIDQQALARFLVAHDQPENVRLWAHSHGNLGVFWSQQDDSCINERATTRTVARFGRECSRLRVLRRSRLPGLRNRSKFDRWRPQVPIVAVGAVV